MEFVLFVLVSCLCGSVFFSVFFCFFCFLAFGFVSFLLWVFLCVVLCFWCLFGFFLGGVWLGLYIYFRGFDFFVFGLGAVAFCVGVGFLFFGVFCCIL